MPDYGHYVNKLTELNETLERREDNSPIIEAQRRLVCGELEKRDMDESPSRLDDDGFVDAVQTVRPDVPEDIIYEVL